MSNLRTRALGAELLESRELLTASGFSSSIPAEPQPAAAAVSALSDLPALRIQPIGDSISVGINAADAARKGFEPRDSYRPHLWNLIQDGFLQSPNVEFVGSSVYNAGDLSAEARAHSAYRGYASFSFFPHPHPSVGSEPLGTINNSTANADGWATLQPDVAMIMLGTNDLLDGRRIQDHDSSLETSLRDMITQLRAEKSDVQILLGTITPTTPDRRNSHLVPVANTMIRELVQPEGEWPGSTATSPIQIVDHYRGELGQQPLQLDKHFADGVHPNTAGDQILAANWWSKLKDLLREDHTGLDVPFVDIQGPNDAISEGQTGSVTVSRSGDLSEPLTVHYTLSGSATAGVDYKAPSGSVVIPAGAQSATVDIISLTDVAQEFDETVTLTLQADVEYQAFSDASADVFIDDGPPPVVAVHAQQDTLTEGETGRFHITRQGDVSAPLTVNYIVRGSAASGTDYQPLSGKVVLPADASAAQVDLALIDDDLVEDAEDVILELVAGDRYLASEEDTATIRVLDNDVAKPVLSIAGVNSQLVESNRGIASFRVTRAGDLSTALTVNYEISGTATAGSDFVAPSGLVTFAPGQSESIIEIAILDDSQAESTESLAVTLAAADAYTVDQAIATAKLLDNDKATSLLDLFNQFGGGGMPFRM